MVPILCSLGAHSIPLSTQWCSFYTSLGAHWCSFYTSVSLGAHCIPHSAHSVLILHSVLIGVLSIPHLVLIPYLTQCSLGAHSIPHSVLIGVLSIPLTRCSFYTSLSAHLVLFLYLTQCSSWCSLGAHSIPHSVFCCSLSDTCTHICFS